MKILLSLGLSLFLSTTALGELRNAVPRIQCVATDGSYYMFSDGQFREESETDFRDMMIVTKHDTRDNVLGRAVAPGWPAQERSDRFTFFYDRLRFGGRANVTVQQDGTSYLDFALTRHLNGEYDSFNVLNLNTHGVNTNHRCTRLHN